MMTNDNYETTLLWVETSQTQVQVEQQPIKVNVYVDKEDEDEYECKQLTMEDKRKKFYEKRTAIVKLINQISS